MDIIYNSIKVKIKKMEEEFLTRLINEDDDFEDNNWDDDKDEEDEDEEDEIVDDEDDAPADEE